MRKPDSSRGLVTLSRHVPFPIRGIQPQLPLLTGESLSLIAGDLGLSRFEDKLSDSWSRGYSKDPAALRATSAFHRIMQAAGKEVGAVVALIDVGPNLGAINRSALLAADNLVIPLAADLFSLQGLKNLGPTIREWRQQWKQIQGLVAVNFELPGGLMAPAGYVVLQHAVRLDRPVRAYAKWLDRIPTVYREAVLGEETPAPIDQGERSPLPCDIAELPKSYAHVARRAKTHVRPHLRRWRHRQPRTACTDLC